MSIYLINKRYRAPQVVITMVGKLRIGDASNQPFHNKFA